MGILIVCAPLVRPPCTTGTASVPVSALAADSCESFMMGAVMSDQGNNARCRGAGGSDDLCAHWDDLAIRHGQRHSGGVFLGNQ